MGGVVLGLWDCAGRVGLGRSVGGAVLDALLGLGVFCVVGSRRLLRFSVEDMIAVSYCGFWVPLTVVEVVLVGVDAVQVGYISR